MVLRANKKKKTGRSEAKKHRKRKIELIYCGPVEDATWEYLHERSFAKLTPIEKQAISWQMVVDAWKLKGRKESELRLDRTTALLKRI